VRRTRLIALILAAVLLGGAAGAQAQDVIAIIKTLGIGAAVKVFGPDINRFINRILDARQAEIEGTTKVVPILSISIGVGSPGRATVGAAQVAGPRRLVEKVQAVAAIDTNFSGVWQIKVLVPVDNLKPWERLSRVQGVGVSAIIDVRI